MVEGQQHVGETPAFAAQILKQRPNDDRGVGYVRHFLQKKLPSRRSRYGPVCRATSVEESVTDFPHGAR